MYLGGTRVRPRLRDTSTVDFEWPGGGPQRFGLLIARCIARGTFFQVV